MTSIPVAVNWHFWPWCNYGCKFCFARFEDIPRADTLAKEEALLVPSMLANAGATKITFVGGEPTLCPYLGELLVASKDAGLTTCIVSNGTGLTEEFLIEYNHLIDWVGISIDASSDEIHAKIGRGLRSEVSNQISNHLQLSKKVWENCRRFGIKMKLNTVVCRENLNDDMTQLVLDLRPDRWKIFQVLPVEGQNDGDVDDLLLKKEEFEEWINRHSWVQNEGISFVPESNELMRGSYAMLDALGRFYTNINGGHKYTSSIIEAGVNESWKENEFIEERFHERGGIYDWDSNAVNLPIIG